MNKWLVRFDKTESIIIKLFRVLSVIGAFVCIILALFNNALAYLWMLPVTYSIGMILLGNNNIVGFTPGIFTLNIVMFCRYLILPIIMSLNPKEVSFFSIQYGKLEQAVLIMWIELIGILVAIFFSGKNYKRKVTNISLLNDEICFVEMKYGDLFCIMGIAIIIVMIIRYPYLIGGWDLITQGYLSEEVDISGISGIVGIVWKSLTTWLVVYFLYILKKINLKGRKLTFFLIIAIAGLVLISFIGQVTISRWYTVVTFGAMYYSVIKMFPQKKKSVTAWIMIPAVTFLFLTSLYKNTEFLSGQGTILEYIKDLFDVTTLDAYLAGPFSVNNALYLKEQVPFGITSVFYDMFRNFPVLNHYIAVENSTVEMYHSYMGRGDQILPLVGQSMIYFSYIFTPLLSIISVNLIRYFDYLYRVTVSLEMYMYAFIAVWIGLVIILNFTICMSWFYSIIIPTFMLLKSIELLGSRKVFDKKMLRGGRF